MIIYDINREVGKISFHLISWLFPDNRYRYIYRIERAESFESNRIESINYLYIFIILDCRQERER